MRYERMNYNDEIYPRKYRIYYQADLLELVLQLRLRSLPNTLKLDIASKKLHVAADRLKGIQA